MTTRRELLQFAGGSAMGLLLTPAPWRLITDTALWSENWPGIPRPARGEIRAKFTHCGLCAAGCAVRARCVGEQPVSLSGVAGGLCPFGVAGHHLPYHPERLKQGNRKEAAEAVARAIAASGPERRVAVLDLQPGRTASWTYRRALAAIPHGVYIAPPEPACSLNFAAARMVLSLGAPLLDGFAQPARVFAARPNFRLIQAEAMESRTASAADEWLPVAPGTEAVLGRAAAGVLPVRQAAEMTGLPEGRIAGMIRALRENGPALIVAPQMTPEVLAWNIALGAWGKTVMPRREAPVPKTWSKAAPAVALETVKDGSIGALLIDESVGDGHLPWESIRPKLATDAVVVAFAWTRSGYARHATHVLPAAVYPEALGDVPPAVDGVNAEFRLTVPLIASPDGTIDPAEFVAALAGLDAKDALRERAAAIHATGRGKLCTYADGKVAAVKDLKPEDFWKALSTGAAWTGDAEESGRTPRIAATFAGPSSEHWPFRVAIETACAPALASPLIGKLTQESHLRLAANRAALHPREGFLDGTRAAIETPYGRRIFEVTVDVAVPPGVVLVAGGPEIADIVGADGCARVVRI